MAASPQFSTCQGGVEAEDVGTSRHNPRQHASPAPSLGHVQAPGLGCCRIGTFNMPRARIAGCYCQGGLATHPIAAVVGAVIQAAQRERVWVAVGALGGEGQLQLRAGGKKAGNGGQEKSRGLAMRDSHENGQPGCQQRAMQLPADGMPLLLWTCGNSAMLLWIQRLRHSCCRPGPTKGRAPSQAADPTDLLSLQAPIRALPPP